MNTAKKTGLISLPVRRQERPLSVGFARPCLPMALHVTSPTFVKWSRRSTATPPGTCPTTHQRNMCGLRIGRLRPLPISSRGFRRFIVQRRPPCNQGATVSPKLHAAQSIRKSPSDENTHRPLEEVKTAGYLCPRGVKVMLRFPSQQIETDGLPLVRACDCTPGRLAQPLTA